MSLASKTFKGSRYFPFTVLYSEHCTTFLNFFFTSRYLFDAFLTLNHEAGQGEGMVCNKERQERRVETHFIVRTGTRNQ